MAKVTLQLYKVDEGRADFGCRVKVSAPEGEAPLPVYGRPLLPPRDGHRVHIGTWITREDWEERGAPLALEVEIEDQDDDQ